MLTKERFYSLAAAVAVSSSVLAPAASFSAPVQSASPTMDSLECNLAVRPVESLDIGEVLYEDNDEDEWYRPDRRWRCIFLYELPARPGDQFKTCAYNCLGYGAGATFTWPANLPCPGSFNGLFPPIPDGYPRP